MAKYITKVSGERELFNIEKFRRSLRRVHASDAMINRLEREVIKRRDLRSTKDIYQYALQFLKQEKPGIAARYAIKRALLDLGPAGFPFEQFIAELFKSQGYRVLLNQIRSGFCVSHELDIIAQKDHTQQLVECKFHNRQQLKSDVQVILAVKARFDDLEKLFKRNLANNGVVYNAWVVTNTKFTSVAIQYGECAGVRLLGWGYPRRASLPQLIDRYKLYPVTTLTSLNRAQKAELIRQHCVLCREDCLNPQLLRRLGLNEQRIERVLQEAHDVCMNANARAA